MKQAPGLARHWLLFGVLVIANLLLAILLLVLQRDWLVSPSTVPVDAPVSSALASPSSVPLSATIASKSVVSPTITRPPSAPTAQPVLTLTLDSIFSPSDISALKLDPTRLRTIVATGDVAPARSTDGIIRARNDDFNYTVAATKDLLAAADITVINLETPLVQNCPPHDSGFKFCARPGFVQALQTAGVDVVTLENNHIGNYGTKGISETIKSLDDARIKWSAGETVATMDVRGVKFGFLAFNGVGRRFDRPTMLARIKDLRPKVDVLVAAVHWGAEYVALPSAAAGIAPDSPIEIAHFLIDAGVDVIIGNHPHWIQGVELYKGKLIAYAHGNFIFDQMWSDKTRKGVVGKYTFYDRTLVKVEYVPVLIENYAQPVPLRGKAAQDVLDQMRAASRELERLRKP